jgi:diguanylate cyclase (GGDEF)-like protein
MAKCLHHSVLFSADFNAFPLGYAPYACVGTLVNFPKPVVIIVGSAIALIAASIGVVRYYTDHFLRGEATHRAETWAGNLVDNVSDLPNIMAGELPVDESVVFFEQARAVGDVWRFRIFDAAGKLLLVSNQIGKTHTFSENLAKDDPDTLAELRAGRAVVNTRAGVNKREPVFIAEALVPVRSGDEPLGYLSVQIDATERQQVYLNEATLMAVTFAALMLVAFGAPAAGFLMRSRQKELAEGKLEHLAYHDSLTGLKNRLAITQHLETFFAGGKAADDVAIHIIDLDGFKEINDTLGHDVGDEVLRQVSLRLARTVANAGVVGRLGGDEFLVVQSGNNISRHAEKLAANLVEALLPPCNINGSFLQAHGSVGLALAGHDGETASDLMKSADIALYFAKAEGRACSRRFLPGMDDKLRRRRDVEQKLRTALKEDGFELYFQPQFNLASDALEGAEALLRLPDGENGMISPAEFIPIAEEVGLILEIGNWVIAEGCRSLELLPPGMKLAINLSPLQFEKGDIVATVAAALKNTGTDPSRLELEVTESLLLNDSPKLQATIGALKALGTSIVLDDFGAGYSSLSYLWRYPFDKIKIDRSFVSSLGENGRVEGVIKSIINLGRDLNLRVTAEGIETVVQAELLRGMQCDQVQGYLFGAPLSLPDLSAAIINDFKNQRLAYLNESRPLARAG